MVSTNQPLPTNMSNVDFQQMMMAIDTSTASANGSLRNNFLAQYGAGAASPNSLASSGAASSAATDSAIQSTTTEDESPSLQQSVTSTLPSSTAPTATETTMGASPEIAGQMAALFAQMQQQAAGLPSSMNNILEQIGAMGNLNSLLANSGLAGLGATSLFGAVQESPKANRQKSPAKPPALPVSPHSTLAALQQFGGFGLTQSPTTSHNSVIVSNRSNDDSGSPVGKKPRPSEDDEEERNSLKSALDNLFMNQLTGTTGGESAGCSCDECGRQFPNLFVMLTHKNKEHSTELLPGLMPTGFPTLPFMLPGLQAGQFGLQDLDPATLSALGGTPSKPPAAKRQYSSNGKNYCDLCNKDVCNKYFLRTHMLKMHNIVIDENKTVIANIDTLEKEKNGGLTFRCDTCFEVFKERDTMRKHKQQVHGVMTLSSTPSRGNNSNKNQSTNSANSVTSPFLISPTVSGDIEKCPMCEKRMPLPQLRAHIQIEHVGGDMNGSQSHQTLHECRWCPASFSDESECKTHEMRLHSIELFSGVAGIKEEKKSDSATMKCPQCAYSTKDARNLEMHLERHERLNEVKRQMPKDEMDEALKLTTDAALKMINGTDRYQCALCRNSYQDETSLEAHIAVMHSTGAVNGAAGSGVNADALNLTIPKTGGTHHTKKHNGVDEEKRGEERNSHTVGRIFRRKNINNLYFGKSHQTNRSSKLNSVKFTKLL
ncbi:hypothetical protein WR25_00057 isoform C [Diploscapter pachys]|uniref:C2H2-type domain-containing protein n=2 Tax=Diploscapter pachys TaxID=2018661 RepID=A0A2A2KDY3_9BILA|nr:hypothetical protein WR25_00057 isoform C [Diploscapter pachys]